MSIIVARVVSLSGQAKAYYVDGEARPLRQGDAVRDRDIVQVGAGGQVVLRLSDGRELVVEGDRAYRIYDSAALPGLNEVSGARDIPPEVSSAPESKKLAIKFSPVIIHDDGTFSAPDEEGFGRGAGRENGGHSFVI